MPLTQKCKQQKAAEQDSKRQQCDISKIFDTDSDSASASASASEMSDVRLPGNQELFAQQQRQNQYQQQAPQNLPPVRPQPLPFRTADSPRPPPPLSSRADRPASAADFDQIMLSIGALTGRFDEVRKDITGIAGRLDGHSAQLASLAREATEDRLMWWI